MTVTEEDMRPFGGIITLLFREMYPHGSTTLEQMWQDAPEHQWIRTVLRRIGEEAEHGA